MAASSDATMGYRVVFRRQPNVQDHINVINVDSDPTTERMEDGRWDGDECLILNPDAHNSNTLRQALQHIREMPQLALLNLPVVRNLQDTMVLWAAWKMAMMDTIGTIFEMRCQATLTQRVDLDDEPVRIRLREMRMQLQTTMGTWREHLKFLAGQRDQLTAGIVQREADVAESRATLDAKCAALARGGASTSRCVAAARVLINAATALESTQNERRGLIDQWHQNDRVAHADTLRSLIEALIHFTHAFGRDLDDVKLQAKLARASVDESIRKKQMAWHEVCQALQDRYQREVHQPLQQLIRDLKANKDQDQPYTEPLPMAIDVVSQALTNENDPHCIRRCEVAQMELAAIRSYLTKVTQADQMTLSSTEDAAWDDDAMRQARRRRDDEERAVGVEHDQRMIALQTEQEARKHALARAKQHMQLLRAKADQLQTQVAASWQQFQDVPLSSEMNKRAAALTRLATQRQANLHDEMQRTNDMIHRLHGELNEARGKVTGEERLTQATRYLAVANSIHDLCRRMRSQFEMAIHAEEIMRRIVSDQFTESARTFHTLSISIIHKVLDTARSQFARTKVALDRIHDQIQEATRRIDTLNKARIQQELRVDGPEIDLYTTLEEHVVRSNQLQQLRDSHVKTKAMCSTCDSALLLLQDLVNVLEGF